MQIPYGLSIWELHEFCHYLNNVESYVEHLIRTPMIQISIRPELFEPSDYLLQA